jgi:prepilin-type N-terminal cleavage/methylation domain-containing protein
MAWRRRHGFTLIEILIALAIAGVVMGVAYRFVAFGARSAGRSGRRIGAVDSASSAFLQLAARLRYAEKLLEPGSGGTGENLEYYNNASGGWTLSVKEGNLVLQEKHGLTKKILAPGVTRVEFERDNFLVKTTLYFGQGQAARSFSSILYARGTRRPPGS